MSGKLPVCRSGQADVLCQPGLEVKREIAIRMAIGARRQPGKSKVEDTHCFRHSHVCKEGMRHLLFSHVRLASLRVLMLTVRGQSAGDQHGEVGEDNRSEFPHRTAKAVHFLFPQFFSLLLSSKI
jgi:hypothetical protein